MTLLEDPDFANDVALVSSTGDQLQLKTSDPSLPAKQLDLNISRKMTKTMPLMDTPLPVELEHGHLEEVEELTQLGNITSQTMPQVRIYH